MSANSDGTEILCCNRSPDGHVIATGDRYGCINLFKYPCPQPDAARSKYVGHSAAVKNLNFSCNGRHLISCGGQDLSIFQWQYKHDKDGWNFAMAAREAGRDAVDREVDLQNKMKDGQRWTEAESQQFK